MIRTHPSTSVREGIAECIEACFGCAQVCWICADACLAEPMVQELRHCIANNMNCATICEATGAMLTRQNAFEPAVIRAQLQACIEICRACGAECAEHGAHMEHCRVCAEECRRCEQACQRLLGQI
jgi:hypothetical protein